MSTPSLPDRGLCTRHVVGQRLVEARALHRAGPADGFEPLDLGRAGAEARTPAPGPPFLPNMRVRGSTRMTSTAPKTCCGTLFILFWFLGVLFGVVIAMLRRHRETLKPTEPHSPGMDEERRHQEPDLEARREDLFRGMDALAAKVRAGALSRPTGGGVPMLRRGGREARFALVSDGYARDQVDTVVEQYERQFGETKVQLERTDLNLAEADSRLQALEARASELEEWGADGSPLPELANDLLHKAKEIGRELESRVLSEAEAEREELKQKAGAAESARARAEEIVAKARRDRDELGRTVEQSRRQVDQFLHDGRMMAEQRGRGVWEKARGRLREPVVELEHLNEQRRAMLKEILELRESVDTSWRRVVSE